MAVEEEEEEEDRNKERTHSQGILRVDTMLIAMKGTQAGQENEILRSVK